MENDNYINLISKFVCVIMVYIILNIYIIEI